MSRVNDAPEGEHDLGRLASRKSSIDSGISPNSAEHRRSSSAISAVTSRNQLKPAFTPTHWVAKAYYNPWQSFCRGAQKAEKCRREPR
jgi:hypothetical protein